MPTMNIAELTQEELLRLQYDKRMRCHQRLVLELDQLYALTLLTLNNAVTRDDYPALASAVKDVTGIQDIGLLVDHRTRVSLPADTMLVADVSIDLNIVPKPQAE